MALPPLSSAPGTGVNVPEGSQVPRSIPMGSHASPGAGVPALPQTGPSGPHLGPGAGLTAAGSRDVDLERAREELPSVATRAESFGSGEARGGGGNATPRSAVNTPRTGYVFPSSVESPSEPSPAFADLLFNFALLGFREEP